MNQQLTKAVTEDEVLNTLFMIHPKEGTRAEWDDNAFLSVF